MQSKHLFAAVTVALSASLAGCVTPQANPQQITITSSPPGAQVMYQGKPIGVTPLATAVRDEFGLLSKYRFTVSKPGYAEETLTFNENTVFHAQGVVPEKAHVDLKLAPKGTLHVDLKTAPKAAQ